MGQPSHAEIVDEQERDGIAGRLSISRRTAEAHRANFMRKLRLGNQVALIQYALARGILMLPGDPLRPADNAAKQPAPS